MAPGNKRNAYRDAIEKVRSQHEASIRSPHRTLECPKCGTRQVIQDVPGMRKCLKCGFEFSPRF